jgi:hypothetical protein
MKENDTIVRIQKIHSVDLFSSSIEKCNTTKSAVNVHGTEHNQSTDGAEFVWVSECQKGEGCEIINQFVFV